MLAWIWSLLACTVDASMSTVDAIMCMTDAVTTVGVPWVQQCSARYVRVWLETQEQDGLGLCEQWASC